jgi:hypothetical protein
VFRVIAAAAVCPHPPLLVPELAAGAAAELDDLRAACDQAVRHLVAAATQALVMVGSDGEAHAGFAPWGVDVPAPPAGLRPLSLLVGDWLLARNGVSGSEPLALPPDAPVAECARLGSKLAADPRRLALLVLGDASRCRGVKAPGYDDPRAQPYDAAVAGALAGADTDALLALDPGLSAELGVAGRAPWQVLAGAVLAGGGAWRGDLLYDAAPYGVAYLVATWSRS